MQGGLDMAEKGTLLFQIYSAHMAIPIKDASVTVTTVGRNPVVIAHRITDESGLTSPIEIYTPDTSESTAPNGGLRFARSNVRLSHPGYYDVIVQDVQVFPGTESIQQMEMIPLPENNAARTPRVYTVTPQTL